MRFVPLLIACGCTDMALNAKEAADATSDSGTSDEADADTDADTDADADSDFIPEWYSLAAVATVDGGVAGSLEPRFVIGSSDLERRDCGVMAPSDLAATAPSSESIYTYWTFTVPTDNGCDGVAGTPARLGVGIGVLDPEVRARLGTVDLDGVADELWGAWLIADDNVPFPFGYAQGAGGAPADGPPPDGSYTLEPLLLLRLSETE